MHRFSNSTVVSSLLCAAALVGCAPDAASDDTAADAPLAQWVVDTDRAGQPDEPIDDGWETERENDDERTRRPQRPRNPRAPEAGFISVKRPPYDRSNSVKVLDVSDWSRDDRGAVQLWTQSNGDDNANQQWRVYQRGDALVIQNAFSGKCLDESKDDPRADGRVVYQYTCDSRKPNQRWEYVARRDGYGELRSQETGRCLDVSNLEYRDGATLQTWECTGAWNQSFKVW